MKRLEIISTGNEILSGATVDTNASYMAGKALEWGLEVKRKTTVGDEAEEMVEVLLQVAKRADICLVSGGLGPTSDDLTAQMVARAGEVELVKNQEACRSLENFFQKMGRSPKENDYKQALFPQGAKCLVNSVGTAPGFWIKIRRCTFFFVPGVPPEMETMMEHEVGPRLMELGGDGGRRVRLVTLFGLREAYAGAKLSHFSRDFPQIELGFRVKFPQIQLRLYHQQEQGDQVEKAVEWIVERVGKWVCSREGRSLEEEVGHLLKEQKATVALAESCTGGLVAHRLTNISGSSEYFLFSGVTYSNEAKTEILGVEPQILREKGAVSEETVMAMARGARERTGATFGLATSGIAGPGGGTEEKPVGTLCLAISSAEGEKACTLHYNFQQRHRNKEFFATAALDLLRRELTGQKWLF